jgi:hypothetical protein
MTPGGAPKSERKKGMTDQNEGPYDGQNWPTHSISVWIENDSRFFDTACNYAKLDETGEEVRAYLTRLLFDRTSLSAEERRRLTCDAVRLLDEVSGALADHDDTLSVLEAFGQVNWQYVRLGLTA